MDWSIEEIRELRGYTVEWAEPGNYYLSRRNILFHSTDLKSPFKKIAVIGAPGWKALASNFRLAQRLLRFMVTNVLPLENGDVFVMFDKSVGVVRDGEYTELPGLVRPCRVLRSACAVDSGGDIFFGEYLANDERGEMQIYRYRPGTDRLEVAYTFPAGSIKHIHGIYLDPFTDSLLCLTGDEPHECRMILSRDGFQTTETVGEGDESWRAVSIQFEKDAMLYGTDAEFRANHIFRMDRDSLERTNLGEVNGTVFYSKKVGDDLFFATTAENAPSQKENVAAIWHVSRSGELRQLAKFHKDGWNGTFFMFGVVHFPCANTLDDELYFSLVGVKEDNRTFRIRRK